MREYKKILVAVDIAEGSERIAQRARDVAQRLRRGTHPAARRRVRARRAHGRGPAARRADRGRTDRAGPQAHRETGGRSSGLEQAEQLVYAGNIKAELVRVAQERGVNLIVLGSRERHGLSIVFNQTEDTILHAAPCDVLAVRWEHSMMTP
jgi:universal stress protein A